MVVQVFDDITPIADQCSWIQSSDTFQKITAIFSFHNLCPLRLPAFTIVAVMPSFSPLSPPLPTFPPFNGSTPLSQQTTLYTPSFSEEDLELTGPLSSMPLWIPNEFESFQTEPRNSFVVSPRNSPQTNSFATSLSPPPITSAQYSLIVQSLTMMKSQVQEMERTLAQVQREVHGLQRPLPPLATSMCSTCSLSTVHRIQMQNYQRSQEPSFTPGFL